MRTAKQKAALRKAQLASARKRKGKGKRKLSGRQIALRVGIAVGGLTAGRLAGRKIGPILTKAYKTTRPKIRANIAARKASNTSAYERRFAGKRRFEARKRGDRDWYSAF